MKNRPTYSIGSVDNALRLAQLLQQEGPMRVTDAAERLGVSPSTAHRLLAMLVYREFAEQQPDRLYRAGPALRHRPSDAPLDYYRRCAAPHLEALVARVEESVNFMILLDTVVLFLYTVECEQVLRVGDRAGRTLPAHLSSGGLAILAARRPADRAVVTSSLTAGEVAQLERDIKAAQRTGFAVNNQRTEKGVAAIGMVVPDVADPRQLAVSIAVPTPRFARERIAGLVRELGRTTRAVADAVAAGDPWRYRASLRTR
jgi:DNA-binding IclR family transcriptional regulator